MPDPKEQEHLDGPAAHASHHRQPLDHVVGRHTPERRHREDDAPLGMVGQVADGLGLGLGKPGVPHEVVRGFQHPRRGGEALVRIQRAKPAEDRRGRLAGELLVHDAVRQCFE